MAGRKGQKSGGHNAKTTAQHIADGTYQKCRHGSRLDNEPAEGKPVKPQQLSEIESYLWDEVVGYLPAASVGRVDTVMLREMCRWYELYRNAFAALQCDPLDRDARGSATAAWDRFWRIASDFGATPVARTRLEKPPADGKSNDDPMASLRRLIESRN